MTATGIRGLTSYAHGCGMIPSTEFDAAASGLLGTGAGISTMTMPRAEPVPRREHAPAVR